jgi:hypothetical protein
MLCSIEAEKPVGSAVDNRSGGKPQGCGAETALFVCLSHELEAEGRDQNACPERHDARNS